MKLLKRLIPIAVSIILIAILIGYAPWPEVWKAMQKLSLASIGLLILFSISYYTLKTIRFQLMLKAMEIRKPIKEVALSYMAAQPVSLLPAGELYRSRTLEQRTGVPMKESAPQFTMQGLLEGAGIAIVGVIATLGIGKLRVPMIILMVAVIAGFIVVRKANLVVLRKYINSIPFVNVSRARLKKFAEGNRNILFGPQLPWLILLSVFIELVGAAAAYVAVTGLGGDIGPFEAIIVYIVPLLVSFVSFLPGGIGASEQSAVGILVLSGLSVAIAVGATLIMRATIVGSGVLYGASAYALMKSTNKKRAR